MASNLDPSKLVRICHTSKICNIQPMMQTWRQLMPLQREELGRLVAAFYYLHQDHVSIHSFSTFVSLGTNTQSYSDHFLTFQNTCNKKASTRSAAHYLLRRHGQCLWGCTVWQGELLFFHCSALLSQRFIGPYIFYVRDWQKLFLFLFWLDCTFYWSIIAIEYVFFLQAQAIMLLASRESHSNYLNPLVSYGASAHPGVCSFGAMSQPRLRTSSPAPSACAGRPPPGDIPIAIRRTPTRTSAISSLVLFSQFFVTGFGLSEFKLLKWIERFYTHILTFCFIHVMQLNSLKQEKHL